MRLDNAKRIYTYLTLAAIMLFNPNISVIDPLPDFIAYFIIARLMVFAADASPYFAEARAAFLRLGYLTLAKLPAFLIIVLIRRGNTLDNDIYALFSFVFAVFEAYLSCIAIKHLFSALFYLGERTEADALLMPFSLSKSGRFTMTPEALRGFSFLFVFVKSATFTLPDMFLLTKTTDSGGKLTISRFYPAVLLGGFLLGLIIGIIWLRRVRKYILTIKKGEFFLSALNSQITESGKGQYEIKIKLRELCGVLTSLIIASFFTFELVFLDLDQINILPPFIYGIAMLVAVFKFKKASLNIKPALFSTIAHIFISTMSYIMSVTFHTRYDYVDLMKSSAAKTDYLFASILATLEFISLSLMLVFIALLLREFILSHTGVDKDSDRYLKMEKEYHKSLIKGGFITLGISFLLGAAKLTNLFLNGNVHLIYTHLSDVTMPTITSGALPWFNLVVFALAALYVGYCIYYFSSLKEEIKIKYERL